MVRRRPSSTRAARARSEESDRDPVDGSSPAERTVTDRRAFVVVARRHTITLKSYTVFLCVPVCVIFPGSGLKTCAGPGRRRCPARARSRRDEATRRTVDGSEETVGRRRFFCVCVRGVVLRRDGRSFATRDLRSFVRVARARALVRDALRASRRLADADARREVTEEIARYARDFPGPIAEASEEEGARALAEAKRRVRELEEMIGMVE